MWEFGSNIEMIGIIKSENEFLRVYKSGENEEPQKKE
jgi:hypothetical protein